MEHKYYTVEEVAKLLSIHPKTIQRYIREGKLEASKIGKSWRISGHDLSRFTEGSPASEPVTLNENQERKPSKASAVIDVSVTGLDEAVRIINAMNAVMNSKPQEYGLSSMTTQFIDADNILRVNLWGSLSFLSMILGSLEVYAE